MATNENPTTSEDGDVLEQLHSARESIDNIDAALVHLLAERFKFTQQVGRLKAKHGLPPADPARESEQIQRLRALAAESHLDPAFAEKFLTFIIAEVIHHHERIAGSAGSASTGSASAGAGSVGAPSDS
ncbi:MAG TPA: chorismate mutase [Microbacteriaceae bacterium]|jgi:chorismate mutase|nr:chorismate mutase [Microbacteriaceae bacterium]